MRKLAVVAVVTIGMLLTTMQVWGHHSFSAEFDINKPITLKGLLTKMAWTNPHGWLYLDVKEAEGKVVNWAVELGAPNTLVRRGLRMTDFPIGTELVVEGYQAKDQTPTANGITLKFPDGRNFFAGSSGTGAPVPTPQRQ